MFKEQSLNGAFEPPTNDSDSLADRVEHLCKLGRYLDAHELVPHLQATGSVADALQAARILWHVGARRLADSQVLSLWRKHRADARARLDMVRTVANRHGPYRAWVLMRATPDIDDAALDVRAEWHSLQSSILGALRDFERAAQAHQVAVDLLPDNAWVHVEWAYVCSQQDRYDEAIVHAEHGLRLSPGYRSAIQALGHLYSLVGREHDAMNLLRQATGSAQSASLGTSLFELQIELGDHEGARATLDYCEHCWPLADADLKEWLAARRADVAMRLGELDVARAQALLAGGMYHERLAARLASDDARPKRVELSVGFVRQHFMTCAPATLAAISGYWGKAADHLGIAEAICYDGTPNHSERKWAEEQGFVTREFTVDWAAATSLIDAGIPFTLTTVATNSAHLQAVIGYDALRGTLLIRDPFKRVYGEFDAAALFESHASSGPRGMVLIPHDEAYRLDGIELPEAVHWDGYHRVMSTLSRHDRVAAVAACAELAALDPGHRLAISARRALAYYDRNEAEGLLEIEHLLKLYPKDANLALQKAGALSVLGSRAENEEWWAAAQEAVGFDPVVTVRYAQFLSEDARQQRKVFGLLERTLAVFPVDATAWSAMGNLEWQRGRRDDGVEFYRIAACLQETNEYYADTYMRACRALRREAEGFEFLRRRTERLGVKSSAPVITLFSQLELVERTDEGFAQLDRVLNERPHDPELLLFAAEVNLRYGKLDRSAELLGKAEPLAKRATWLRLQALLQRDTGEPERAIIHARQACELEPLNLETHRLVASLISQIEGRRAAADDLRSVARRYPHHADLQRLLLSWLPDDALEEAVAVLRSMLEISPHDAWARRELVVKLVMMRKLDEAEQQARLALEMAPRLSSSHSTLGFVCWRQGNLAEARQRFRDAVHFSADNDYAVGSLLEIETTLDAKRQALAFVRDELVRQTTMGDGLLAFQEAARQVMEPDELLAFMQYALNERPDLWHCWVATAAQLTRMSRHAEALKLLDQAIERFSLLPRVYVEKASTLLSSGQRDAARECLTRALHINAFWPVPVRMYVDSVLDEGTQLDRALPVLERALNRTPDNADLRGLHGWLQWRLGQSEQALAELQKAVVLSPDLRWIWDALKRVGQESGHADIAQRAAEEVTAQRPGDAWAWLRLAEFSVDPARALSAVEKGLALEPRHQALFEMRLQLLLEARRYADIEAALQAAPWGKQLPLAIAAFRSRVSYATGNVSEALRDMRALLDSDSSNFQLWRQLADWYDHNQRHGDYQVAAQHMVRLAPMAAVSYGYLGHAWMKLGRKLDAKLDLRRAFELDPSYSFAGLQLADLAIAEGLSDEASQVLDLVERSDRSAVVALRRMRLGLLRQDQGAALAKAAEVVSTPGVHPDLVDLVLQEIRQAGWMSAFAKEIQRLISEGRCSLGAAKAWLAHVDAGWLPGGFYRAVSKQVRLYDPSHVLAQAFLQWLAEKKDGRMLSRFVLQHAQMLRADLESWAQTGYALLTLDRNADAAAWMSDWRNRPAAPDWALDNLAVALRALNRDTEARVVSQQSLQVNPRNMDAQVWMAFDAAWAGKLDELRALLPATYGSGLRPYYQQLVEAMHAYLRAAESDNSTLAVEPFLRLRQQRAVVLTRLLNRLAQELIDHHTPRSKRLWRRMQFWFGWS